MAEHLPLSQITLHHSPTRVGQQSEGYAGDPLRAGIGRLGGSHEITLAADTAGWGNWLREEDNPYIHTLIHTWNSSNSQCSFLLPEGPWSYTAAANRAIRFYTTNNSTRVAVILHTEPIHTSSAAPYNELQPNCNWTWIQEAIMSRSDR